MKAVSYFLVISLLTFLSNLPKPVLTPTAIVRGRVYDSFGLPETNATLHLLLDGKAIMKTSLDASSSYKFEGVPKGTYICKVVKLDKPGNTIFRSKTVEVEEGREVTVDIIVLRQMNDENPFKTEISGVVTTPSGRPIKNAKVKLVNPFEQKVASESYTDDEGAFVVVAPYKGQYLIQAFSLGHLIESKSVLANGNKFQLNLTLNTIGF